MFEALWVGEEQCTKIIEDAWNQDARHGLMTEVMGLITINGTKLKGWNKTTFGNV